MYSYGPPHMAGEKLDDQHEHTSSSYVRIQDVPLKTCQRQWTIGRSGKRRSGMSVPAAWHDDDDDDDDDVKYMCPVASKAPKKTMFCFWCQKFNFQQLLNYGIFLFYFILFYFLISCLFYFLFCISLFVLFFMNVFIICFIFIFYNLFYFLFEFY